jgi:hypothetical protein
MHQSRNVQSASRDTFICWSVVEPPATTERLYRPRREILDGTYKFPEAQQIVGEV